MFTAIINKIKGDPWRCDLWRDDQSSIVHSKYLYKDNHYLQYLERWTMRLCE